MLNSNSATLITMLKTAEFKNEGFGWIWTNEWMNGVIINCIMDTRREERRITGSIYAIPDISNSSSLNEK